MSLLSSRTFPESLRTMTQEELCALAEELRQEILQTVSQTGGHLASNLGIVELTIAVLRVFSPPEDKILFDVSHQAYAYKLLTGRGGERFHFLRKTGGLSGFQKRSESPYDAFGSGHAGNTISAALGLATARDLRHGKEHVVSVIGDASIANGISMEALNNVREATSRLVLLLNDNGMSIGRPTGGFSRMLGRLIASPRYNRFKSALEEAGARHLGKNASLRRFYHTLESRIKSLFLQRRNSVFEQLGIRYIGPVDGHNLEHLCAALESAKDSKIPVVVHISTVKGLGYEPAQTNPEAWHSAAPFDIAAGKPTVEKKPNTVSWSACFGKALCELAEKDPRIFAISAGMTDGTGLKDFARTYKDRFRDVGICEEHQMIYAAGLSAGGMRPVVAVYSTFLQRAVDGVIHDVALQRLPVVLALDRAGVVPGDGATHHGIFDIALLRPVPGIVIAQPRTPADLRRLLRTAFTLSGPMMIRYPRGSAPDNTEEDRDEQLLPIGKAQVLSQRGEKPTVAIWTLGPEDSYAEELMEKLSARGVSSVHVDARFVKPLDTQLLRRQAEEGIRTFFTFEDGICTGGFGDAVADALAALPLPPPRLVRFGWPDAFVPHASSRADLLQRFHLTPEDALQAILPEEEPIF